MTYKQPQVTSEPKKQKTTASAQRKQQTSDSGYSSPVWLQKRVGPCCVRSVIMSVPRPNRQLSNQVRRRRPFILMTTPGRLLSSGVEGLTGPLRGGLATGTDGFSTKCCGPCYITKNLPIWRETTTVATRLAHYLNRRFPSDQMGAMVVQHIQAYLANVQWLLTIFANLSISLKILQACNTIKLIYKDVYTERERERPPTYLLARAPWCFNEFMYNREDNRGHGAAQDSLVYTQK